MTFRRWSLYVILIFSAGLALVAAFNLWMDPFMTFGINHAYNGKQTSQIEMLAKFYHLHTHPGRYQEIFVGKAATAQVNVPDDMFNFGYAGYAEADAPAVIDFLLKTNPGLKKIYLGFDSTQYLLSSYRFARIADVPAQVADPLFRFKQLLFYDTLNFSITNFLNNFIPALGYYYDRKFNTYSDPQQMTVTPNNSILSHGVVAKYESYLQAIANFKDIEFVVYTNPMVESRLRLFHKNREKEYRDWLRLLVRYFGRVEHFAYLNKVTLDSSGNFYSGIYFYDRVGDLIFNRLKGVENPDQKDFGVTLTAENFTAEMEREDRLLGGGAPDEH